LATTPINRYLQTEKKTMSRKIGYIDESGDKSIRFEKKGVTTFLL